MNTERKITSCTTFQAGKNTNVYNCSIVGHSSDQELQDQSLQFVPARDWPSNQKRSIYQEQVQLGEYPIWNSFATPHLNLPAYERTPDYDYYLDKDGQYNDFNDYLHFPPPPCPPGPPPPRPRFDEPTGYDLEMEAINEERYKPKHFDYREDCNDEWIPEYYHHHDPDCERPPHHHHPHHPPFPPPAPRPPFPYPPYHDDDKWYGNYFEKKLPIPRTIKIGEIQQVPHTFAYIDSVYGIMNEKGLSFGECTNGTDWQIGPTDSDTGLGDVKRLFYSSELSRVALERCSTAREQIQLMGNLIDTYGYWGTGETLPIADGNEQWIMEMQPSKDGIGGYWQAQRVPDDEVAWQSNNNIIRTLWKNKEGAPYEQYFGEKVWVDFDPGNSLPTIDFAHCVTSKNEYNHPYYSMRRRWRALSLMAPSLNLPPTVQDGFDTIYPFSVKPDKKLTLNDFFAVYRDHYEGTSFDLTTNVIDPFGNPNRYNTTGMDAGGDVGTQPVEGQWERSISWYYTNCTWICVHDPDKDRKKGLDNIIWVAMNVPGEQPFVPLQISPVPKSYIKVSAKEYDENKQFWTYNRVAEECYRKYCFIKPDITAKQKETEEFEYLLLVKLQDDPHCMDARRIINNYAEITRKRWDKFRKELIITYNQGFKLQDYDPRKPWSGSFEMQGYPKEWLANSPWKDGPTSYDGSRVNPIQNEVKIHD